MLHESSKFLMSVYKHHLRAGKCDSLRSFASAAGIPASLMSYILNGRRLITEDSIEKIGTSLPLSKQQLRMLRKLQQDDAEKTKLDKIHQKKSNRDFFKLNDDHLYLLRDPLHRAILSLAQNPKFKCSAQSIMEKFGVSSMVAHEILDRFIRLQLMTRIGNEYKLTSVHYTSQTDIPSSTIREVHKTNLRLALAALEEIPVECRDFSSFTFAFDVRKMKAAKKELERLRRRFVEKFSVGSHCNDAFTINIQFFSLTKIAALQGNNQ